MDTQGGGSHRPVVVLLHGGFWRGASTRVLMRRVAGSVVARGWVALTVEYGRPGILGGPAGPLPAGLPAELLPLGAPQTLVPGLDDDAVPPALSERDRDRAQGGGIPSATSRSRAWGTASRSAGRSRVGDRPRALDELLA
ncbi:MAG TPA: hypothetical protein VMB72_01140 [Acidimicrobiales bacterium]|nr:hypothetical protein [Acidimicrobiales bacterium]